MLGWTGVGILVLLLLVGAASALLAPEYQASPAYPGGMTHDPFAPGSGTSPGGYGPPPGQHGSGYGPPHPAGPTSLEPKAWIALLCAVLAYTPTVPFLGAIAALILARSARRDILASGGRLTGLSLCTWAVVLSWVHLVFVALLVLLVVVLLAVGIALPFGLAL